MGDLGGVFAHGSSHILTPPHVADERIDKCFGVANRTAGSMRKSAPRSLLAPHRPRCAPPCRHREGASGHGRTSSADPTADGLCRHVLWRIGHEGKDRGSDQVTGIGSAHADAATSLASNGGADLQGLRDAAILWIMRDTPARFSEAAWLRCSDV